LNPRGRQSDEERARSAEFEEVRHDPVRQVWLAPFMMAPINTRVVRRSNALFAEYDRPYGGDFAYEEAMELQSRWAAYAFKGGMGLFEWILTLSAGRWLLGRVGPAPGEGPSEEAMDQGSLRVRLVGEAADGRKALATISADGDPGNRVTVKILCEAALALATQRDQLPGAPARGGVLTPATGLGLVLLERLKAVGFRVEIAPLS
jgi:short subunit dehydrogenase-like uncharacterized protein